MKKLTRPSAILLALIMCLGILYGCTESTGISVESVTKDPYTAVENGSKIYIEQLDARYGNAFAVFDKLAAGVGTYTMDVSVPSTADVNFKAVADGSTGAYNATLKAGSNGISTEFSLWGDKQNLAFKIPVLLGSGEYGVKLDTLEEDLNNSELITALTGMTFDEIKSAFEESSEIRWDDLMTLFKAETWTEPFNVLANQADDFYRNKLTPTIAEDTLTVSEEEVSAITVEYNVSAEASESLGNELIAELENTALLTVLSRYADETAEEDESEEEAPEAEVCKFYLNKDTGTIMAAEFLYGEDEKIAVNYGKGASEAVDITVTMSMPMDEDSFSMETVEDPEELPFDMELTVKEVAEEGKRGFDVGLKYTFGDDELDAKVSVMRANADGKYEIKVTANGEETLSAGGALTYSDTEFTLTLDSVTVGGITSEIGLSLSAKAEGTVEAVPEYENILNMTVEDLEGLAGMFGGIMDSEDDPGYDEYPDESADIYEGLTDEEIAALESMMAEMGDEPEGLPA